MKSLVIVGSAHVLGLAILVSLGLAFNDTIKDHTSDYQGVTTVLSVAFGLYCFAVNFLYHKNQNVYLLVNRLLLMVRRTHTYWLPAFDFTLSDTSLQHRRGLIAHVETALAELPHRKIKRINETPSSATICIDDKLFLALRLDDSHLFVTLDRRILVPSHLYETYRQWLARIGEIITKAVRPESVRLGMQITFDDGAVNPYYGFFVRRVPSHVLRHFEASFQFGHGSTCRIEAATDSINIEGTSAVDFYSAISQVLALKAAPAGGTPV